jgi:hypothetical protein
MAPSAYDQPVHSREMTATALAQEMIGNSVDLARPSF